jgi:hypothetical protein
MYSAMRMTLLYNKFRVTSPIIISFDEDKCSGAVIEDQDIG